MLTRISSIACTLSVLVGSVSAHVRLPQFFSSHMVLQRDSELSIWGFADPQEQVLLEFGDQKTTAAADAEGHWRVQLNAMPASTEGATLRVQGLENEIRLDDVLVGEVWLCSGQSNMVWSVNGADGAEEAKAQATDPRIRMFTGARISTPHPQTDLQGSWTVGTGESVGDFSAAAYYFGRELLSELDVPIGLINVSWGGSRVEAWTTLDTLRQTPAAKSNLETYQLYALDMAKALKSRSDPELDDREWETASLPAMFKDIGHDIDGIIWFRREVALPAKWRGKPLRLNLGGIDDEDHTYVQGVEVGNTNNWQAKRSYLIPASATSVQSLSLAVRVRDGSGPGGFHGAAEEMSLRPEGEEVPALPLSGEWRVQVATSVNPPADQHRPAHLFNGMLHPLIGSKVRGVIWYQGENNAIREEAVDYYELLPAFIQDLREQWGQPRLPFIQVQLPNFGRNGDAFWNYPIVRDAQLLTLHELPDVGLAITIDIGDAKDIHPRNKRDVGKRLAAWALAKTYGHKSVVASGPVMISVQLEASGARIGFETYGSKLKVRGDEQLGGFTLAGSDEIFHPAQARLDQGQVVLECAEVPEPVAVRYAWGNDPSDANLVNAAGLPASPFRSDKFPLF
ncbi:MAG: sialate O-acetylesterase [Planctomycetota bacterium]|jgi:sialate O-acetylesterase